MSSSSNNIKAKVVAAALKAGFPEVDEDAVKLLLKQLRKSLQRTQHNLHLVLHLCGNSPSAADAAHVKAVLAIEHSCGSCPKSAKSKEQQQRGGRVAMPIQYFDTEAFPHQYLSSPNTPGEVNVSRVDPAQLTRPALPATFPATLLLAGGGPAKAKGAAICAEDVDAMLAKGAKSTKGAKVAKATPAAQRALADHLNRVLSGLLKCARATVPDKHKRLTAAKLQAACQHHLL